MASSSYSFLAIFIIFIAYSLPFVLTSTIRVQFSTISAAPAFLPEAPLASLSPALSPDIEPQFPTDGAAVPSPSEPSLPTIPSSPSPPNPDVFEPLAPGPLMAISPSGSLPTSLSIPSAAFNFSLFFLGLVFFCTVQLSAL